MQILQNIYSDAYIYHTYIFIWIIQFKILFKDLLCLFLKIHSHSQALALPQATEISLFSPLMAVGTNHHFPAATLLVCGHPYPDLGTKGSWDTCSGTHGLVWFTGDCSGSWGREEVGPGHSVLGAGWWQEVLMPLWPGLPRGVWRCQGALVGSAGHRPGLSLQVEGDGLQEAPPTHMGDLCILVALSYTFACVITSRAGRLKLPRVILGQATITTSFCCGDMTFDCLLATGFGSGPVAKAVSLA